LEERAGPSVFKILFNYRSKSLDLFLRWCSFPEMSAKAKMPSNTLRILVARMILGLKSTSCSRAVSCREISRKSCSFTCLSRFKRLDCTLCRKDHSSLCAELFFCSSKRLQNIPIPQIIYPHRRLSNPFCQRSGTVRLVAIGFRPGCWHSHVRGRGVFFLDAVT
jgi:hypothetical protein